MDATNHRGSGRQPMIDSVHQGSIVALPRVIMAGVLEQIVEREREPRVPLLVVELELPVHVLLAGQDAVVLGRAHASPEHVPRVLASLHGKGPRVDHGQAAIAPEVGPLPQALDPVDALRDVVGLLRGHGHLERELRVAEQKVGHGAAPGAQDCLALLNQNVQGVYVFLHHAEEVGKLAADLRGRLVRGVVALLLGLVVRRGQDEGHVHVEIVGVLDAADELIQLVLEVLPARGGHHEVVLEHDGHALADHVPGEGALGLREGAGRRLVRDAGRHALVEGPDVPLDLAVDLLLEPVRQDLGRKRRVGGVRDEAIDPIGQPRVGPLQDVRQVPAAVAFEALQVGLDVSGGRAKEVFIVLDGGLGGLACVGPATMPGALSVGKVRGVETYCIGALALVHAQHLLGWHPPSGLYTGHSFASCHTHVTQGPTTLLSRRWGWT